MSATISPQQRQRILHAHYLRQTGAGPKSIAANLQSDPATIQEDLQLLEQHWHDIARQAANDALLSSLAALQTALTNFLKPHPDGRYRYAPKLEELLPLCRELRQTAHQLHKHSQIDRPESPTDYPDDQLAAPEPDRSKSIRIDHSRSQSIRIDHNRSQSITVEQNRTPPNRPDQIETPPPPPRKTPPKPKIPKSPPSCAPRHSNSSKKTPTSSPTPCPQSPRKPAPPQNSPPSTTSSPDPAPLKAGMTKRRGRVWRKSGAAVLTTRCAGTVGA